MLDAAVRSQTTDGGPKAFTFNLENTGGAPADPPAFTSVEWKWRLGDTIPLGPGRALKVVGERATELDETPVLVVEDVPEGVERGNPTGVDHTDG